MNVVNKQLLRGSLLQPQPSAGRCLRYGEGCGAAPGHRTGLSPPRHGTPRRVPPSVSWARTPRGKEGSDGPRRCRRGGWWRQGQPHGDGPRRVRAQRGELPPSWPRHRRQRQGQGHSWGWEHPRRAVEQGRCTPQAAPPASLLPPSRHLCNTPNISSPVCTSCTRASLAGLYQQTQCKWQINTVRNALMLAANTQKRWQIGRAGENKPVPAQKMTQ